MAASAAAFVWRPREVRTRRMAGRARSAVAAETPVLGEVAAADVAASFPGPRWFEVADAAADNRSSASRRSWEKSWYCFVVFCTSPRWVADTRSSFSAVRRQMARHKARGDLTPMMFVPALAMAPFCPSLDLSPASFPVRWVCTARVRGGTGLLPFDRPA